MSSEEIKKAYVELWSKSFREARKNGKSVKESKEYANEICRRAGYYWDGDEWQKGGERRRGKA